MHLDAFLSARLQHMERVLAGCEGLASTFSVACASSIASRGWRNTPPVVTMSRAPRLARPSPRPTRPRWRILLRQTEQHRRQKLTIAKPP